MKFSTVLSALTFASVAYGHTIFQKISVNGAEQAQLRGVIAPGTNNPIQNVNDQNMACNQISRRDGNVIDVPAGARVGAWWGHIIGGAQGPNDPDHPIAPSHKGPTMVYLAKVPNAATASPNGLRWFKVSEEGLNNGNGQWGVDTMIRNGGWQYFTMPTCIEPGHYLMRIELIALHSAYSQGGAQFYIGCGQINLTGGGSVTPSETVSFPGAYQGNHPGITISIYQGTIPNNSGRPYSIPGPRPFQCPANSPPPVTPAPNPGTPQPPVQQPPSQGGAPLYAQCGGQGWTGATTCSQGVCKAVNEWYSQCVPS